MPGILVARHEIGLRRLGRRPRPDRTRQRRLRSIFFYSGRAVLLIAVESPIDYWADDYSFVPMIQHLLLMFAARTLVVAGAPWQPRLGGLHARLRAARLNPSAGQESHRSGKPRRRSRRRYIVASSPNAHMAA